MIDINYNVGDKVEFVETRLFTTGTIIKKNKCSALAGCWYEIILETPGSKRDESYHFYANENYPQDYASIRKIK